MTYTDPEVAAVGLTEEQAREEYGDDVRVGSFPFAANSRAQIYGDTTGFVKVIYEDRWHELLGVVMVGSHVSDMISAGVNALEAESTIETIAYSIQAHPTLAESIKEAGARRARPGRAHAAEAEAREGGRVSEARCVEAPVGMPRGTVYPIGPRPIRATAAPPLVA